MPHTQYDFTSSEQEELSQLRDRLARHGGLYACDSAGELVLDATNRPAPLEYVVLRGRRYLMDRTGRIWRFFAEGSRKNPAAPDGGGAPWRNSRVEMWNGRWRRVVGPDGKSGYDKVLVSRPLDKRINGQPGKSQIDWYCDQKHYRHPHDEPHEPTPDQREALDAGRHPAPVAARIALAADSAAGQDPAPSRSTNRNDTRSSNR